MRIAPTLTAVLALAFAAAVIAPAAPAAAQSSTQVTQPSQQLKKKTVKRPVRRAPRQIACTEFGCHPIPPNCHPQTGYRWDGMPSGFDIVVCR